MIHEAEFISVSIQRQVRSFIKRNSVKAVILSTAFVKLAACILFEE
jgi:hypothetical protein